MMTQQKRKTSPKSTSALLGSGSMKNTSAKIKPKNTNSSISNKKRKVSPKVDQMGYWWGIGGAGGSFILATIAKHFFGV